MTLDLEKDSTTKMGEEEFDTDQGVGGLEQLL